MIVVLWSNHSGSDLAEAKLETWWGTLEIILCSISFGSSGCSCVGIIEHAASADVARYPWILEPHCLSIPPWIRELHWMADDAGGVWCHRSIGCPACVWSHVSYTTSADHGQGLRVRFLLQVLDKCAKSTRRRYVAGGHNSRLNGWCPIVQTWDVLPLPTWAVLSEPYGPFLSGEQTPEGVIPISNSVHRSVLRTRFWKKKMLGKCTFQILYPVRIWFLFPEYILASEPIPILHSENSRRHVLTKPSIEIQKNALNSCWSLSQEMSPWCRR